MKILKLFLFLFLFFSPAENYAQNIPSLTTEEKETLSKTKVFRVIVEQSYELPAKKINLPFYAMTKKLLEKHSNMKVVPEHSNTYDATLLIKLNGTPLSDSYGNNGKSYYTGAKLEGNLILTLDSKTYNWQFLEIHEPDRFIVISANDNIGPDRAPFEAVIPNIYPHILEVLAYIKGIEPLVSSLKDIDPNIRKAAAVALGQIKDPRAVELLLNTFKDKDNGVRYVASLVIGKMNDPSAVEPLISSLKVNDPNIRKSAVNALGRLKDPRAVEPLLTALMDKNYDVHKDAHAALFSINSNWTKTEETKRKIPIFVSSLKDKNLNLRKAAASTLFYIDDPSTIEPLKIALKDKDADVRTSAAGALGRIKAKSAVGPLIIALKDKNMHVRWIAANALAEINDPSAVEPLIHTLKDNEAMVRQNAADALRKISNQKFGQDTKAWQKWWSENKDILLKWNTEGAALETRQ